MIYNLSYLGKIIDNIYIWRYFNKMTINNISQGELIFMSNITVLVNHLNYGNHLGYDSVLSIVQEVRMRYLRTLQLSEVSIEGDIGYLVTKVNVEYKQEAFHGDELIVKLFINNISPLSMELASIIENSKTKKIVAICITKHLFYNYKLKKISKISNKTIEVIKSKIKTL